jgi:peptide/nickel transport system permease protein
MTTTVPSADQQADADAAAAVDQAAGTTRWAALRRPGVPRIRVNLKLIVGLIPLFAFAVVAVVGPWVIPFSATDVIGVPSVSPNGTYYMGTDATGLDVFSRVVAATRNDLTIGLATAVVATVAGILVGLMVGMNESKRGPLGALARGVSRSLDLLQAIPAIVIGLVLVAFLGTNIWALTFAMAVILAPNQARMVRTEVLRVRTEAYLDAARMSGQRELALTLRHVLPNASWPALENTTVVFSAAVLLTATLGFLGVGLHPPTPEWGSMISTGASDAAVGRWWPAFFPAVAIIGCVFAVSSAGQALFGRK